MQYQTEETNLICTLNYFSSFVRAILTFFSQQMPFSVPILSSDADAQRDTFMLYVYKEKCKAGFQNRIQSRISTQDDLIFEFEERIPLISMSFPPTFCYIL